MLLPDKHIRIAESILGLAALILARLEQPLTFNALMASLGQQFLSVEWPASHNAENVALALCFLFSVGLIDVSKNGDLYRCA